MLLLGGFYDLLKRCNFEDIWYNMNTWVAEFPDGVNIIEQLCMREATCYKFTREHVRKAFENCVNLGVKRIEKHVIGAKPLGGVDSRDKERVF